ncbi:Putative Flp pilus-assembly TadG-like N-terminal domain-containing protein [Sphingomonas antarctica]|uniref:Tad domain-containing protein n=1 Tax=Sphingomonas antarctica TaxID=2040274 RepID=UPI0039E89044
MREYPKVNRYSGVLGRLRRDKAGSTLAIMAAAMIPTIVLAGSAIDVTRMYVTKVRLQQACDAGVLAGRKFLADSNATTLDANAQTQAQKFFGNNFKPGWMGTTSVLFTPSKTADNQVSGIATATVPMTVMASFGQTQKTLSTTCEARFDVADADIMFVLDTTGSMSCTPADNSSCSGANVNYTRADGSAGFYSAEKSGSKMQATRDAVLAFYDTMVANADPSTHIRYGFVPYNAQVNVGKLLPTSSLVTQWHYQSRRAVGDVNSGSPVVVTTTGVDSVTCNAQNNTRSLPRPTNDYKFDTSNTAYTYTFNSWTAASGGTCKLNRQTVTPRWRYGQWDFDVSAYVNGASVQDPSMFTTSMNKWRGCVEERDTTATTTFNSANLPPDLDPDIPASDTTTKWRPVWPEVMWYRNQNGPTTSGTATLDPNPYSDSTTPNGISGSFDSYNDEVTCMKSASRIATMSRSDISSFVNDADFKPAGSTYHDIGMIWGLRLLSPTGMFGADTAAWPGRNSPNRHIIFMTDGFMAPTTTVYSAYGVEQLDRRVTGGSIGNQTANHNARFKAVCAAAKARNITVWMIAFGRGGGLTPEMQACASPGKAFYVDSAPQLTDKFKEIATQIAQLRLSK